MFHYTWMHSINLHHLNKSQIKINQNPNINLDFEENSPFQEGIIFETIQRLDKSFFQNLKELKNLIDKGNLIHRFLPKQTDIDKILQIIQRKVLKGTHLPVEVKRFKKDIYTALTSKTYINICYRISS